MEIIEMNATNGSEGSQRRTGKRLPCMLFLGAVLMLSWTTASAQTATYSTQYSPPSSQYPQSSSQYQHSSTRYRSYTPSYGSPTNTHSTGSSAYRSMPTYSSPGSSYTPSYSSNMYYTPSYSSRQYYTPSYSYSGQHGTGYYQHQDVGDPYGGTAIDLYGTGTNQYGAEPVASGTGVPMPKRYIGSGRIGSTEPTFWGMATDLLLVRPAGLVTTVAGSLGYVVSLPFTLTAGNADVAGEKFVLEPARNTFTRPIGTSWDNPDPYNNR